MEKLSLEDQQRLQAIFQFTETLKGSGISPYSSVGDKIIYPDVKPEYNA